VARNFLDAKAHVLKSFYYYIIKSDSFAFLSADDLRPIVSDMSSAHIYLALRSLRDEKLVEDDEDDHGQEIFGLTEAGVLNAEKLIVDSGLTLDEFEHSFYSEIPEDDPVELRHDDLAEARKALADLEKQITEANDIGDLTESDREAAASEVSQLRAALDGNAVRPATFLGRVSETLGWIIKKAGETTVSELAKRALGLLFKYFEGF
jgi:DNA-binding PadR family transcriptional regulator